MYKNLTTSVHAINNRLTFLILIYRDNLNYYENSSIIHYMYQYIYNTYNIYKPTLTSL